MSTNNTYVLLPDIFIVIEEVEVFRRGATFVPFFSNV